VDAVLESRVDYERIGARGGPNVDTGKGEPCLVIFAGKNMTGCPCHCPVTAAASTCMATMIRHGAPFVSDAGVRLMEACAVAALTAADLAAKSIVARSAKTCRRIQIGIESMRTA
jgi:hypothetical protein